MKNSRTLLVCSLVCWSACALGLLTQAHPSSSLPAFVSRASDSISGLFSSGRSQNVVQQAAGSQPGSATILQQQQPPIESLQQRSAQAPSVAGSAATVGPAPQAPSNNSSIPMSMSALQAHLSAMQTQAQRQMSQLNGLMLSGANQLVANSPLAAHAANLTANSKYGNVLEVLSNVGKAIQQQMTGGGQIQIITSPSAVGSELANTKKNEYQSISSGPTGTPAEIGQQQQQQQLAGALGQANGTSSAVNYREQGEQLRQEIVRRAGQLQQVVASSMEVLKSSGDLIVRRLLEQLNSRLDQAKSKADKIINEPATNDVAIKALNTINQGLNNLNNIITNVVNRLDISTKDAVAAASAAAAASAQRAPASGVSGSNGSGGTFLDPARFKLNFHQIGQQFSAVLGAAQQQRQQLMMMQQQPTAGVQPSPAAGSAPPAPAAPSSPPGAGPTGRQ